MCCLCEVCVFVKSIIAGRTASSVLVIPHNGQESCGFGFCNDVRDNLDFVVVTMLVILAMASCFKLLGVLRNDHCLANMGREFT